MKSLSPHLTPPLIWLNLLTNLSTSAQCSHRFTVIPTGFPNRCVVIRRTLTVGLLQPVGSTLHHLTSSPPSGLFLKRDSGSLLLESYWMQIFGSRPMSVKENAVVFRGTVWSEGRRLQLDAWVWKWQKQKKERDRQIGRQTWCNYKTSFCLLLVEQVNQWRLAWLNYRSSLEECFGFNASEALSTISKTFWNEYLFKPSISL